MIVTVGGTKGGIGKSTLTVNFAAELTRQGKRLVIVDADDTGTSMNWGRDREERSPDSPHLSVIPLRGAIRPKLVDLEEAYGLVLVDVGGHDSQEFRQAAVTSDFLLLPVTTSMVDIDPLAKVSQLLAQFRDFNPSLGAHCIFNRVETNSPGDRLNEARQHVREEYPEIAPLETKLHDRVAYKDSMRLGRGVVEWTDYKAKAELQVLVEEIFNVQA